MNYLYLISNGIKRLRNSLGLTQDEFSSKIDMSIQGLRNIEQGKYQPTADTIDKICDTFHISPFDLLIEPHSGDKNSAILTINKKLKTCSIEQLTKIDETIDIIKK